jgi:hypothetical protein
VTAEGESVDDMRQSFASLREIAQELQDRELEREREAREAANA